MPPTARRRSPVGPLLAVAAVLTVLAPVVFVGVWMIDGTLEGVGAALLALLADLAAVVLAVATAAVLATQRGVRYVRTVVTGHPDGRAGRLAEHDAARWALARERFAALQREYAAFETDPAALAARPALADVSVPATARFVEAFADAQYLLTDVEPGGTRRRDFAAAVDRAVAAWHEAGRTAEALARSASATRPARDRTTVPVPPMIGPARPAFSAVPGGHRHLPGGRAPEYGEAVDAVRRAAARGVRDLRRRLDA